MVGCSLRTSVGFLRKRVGEMRCCGSVRTKGENPTEQIRWLRRDAWRSKRCFVKELTFWSEEMRKAGYVKREISSSALRWPRMEEIK